MAANGSTTQATVNTTFQPIFNAAVPKEGPKAIPLRLDFTAFQTITVDLTQQQQQAKISFLQGAYIDNSNNNAPFSIQAGQSQQVITIPPNSQAFVPLLLPNPPIFQAATVGSAVVTVVVLNVPMDIAIWSVMGDASLSAQGYLNTSDVALDALIAGGALTTADKNLVPLITTIGSVPGLDVNVVSGGGGGSSTNYDLIYTEKTTAGNTLLFSPAGGKSMELNSITVILEPEAYLAGGGAITFQLIDFSSAGPALFSFDFFVPTALPTTGLPITLLNLTDLAYKGAAIGGNLDANLSSTFTGSKGLSITVGAASV